MKFPVLFPGECVVLIEPNADSASAKRISDLRIAPMVDSHTRICISCGAKQSDCGTLPCDH